MYVYVSITQFFAQNHFTEMKLIFENYFSILYYNLQIIRNTKKNFQLKVDSYYKKLYCLIRFLIKFNRLYS